MDRLRHPFERWPPGHRRVLLIVVSIAALLPTVLGAVVKPLHEDVTGEGIIDFELAGSVDRAEEILAAWEAEDVIDDAKAIQVFDFVYPVIYAFALAGGCIAAAGAWRRRGNDRMAKLGIAMAWVAFAAAGFDYIENIGLDVSLWDGPATPWPQIAMVAALAKFACIWGSLLYALTGLVAASPFGRRESPRMP